MNTPEEGGGGLHNPNMYIKNKNLYKETDIFRGRGIEISVKTGRLEIVIKLIQKKLSERGFCHHSIVGFFLALATYILFIYRRSQLKLDIKAKTTQLGWAE